MKAQEQESGRRILLGDNIVGGTTFHVAADRVSVCWKWDSSLPPLYAHIQLTICILSHNLLWSFRKIPKSCIQDWQSLMVFRKIIAFYCANNTEHINKKRGQNV